MFLAGTLLALQLLTNRPIPIGTYLQVRLTTTSGSYASRPGDAVAAELIVPVTETGETKLPAGSKLLGTLKSVQKVGFGLLHETASLDFEFNQITLPDGTTLPVSTRVQAVDTGRERVTRDGSIRGQRKTGSLAFRFGSVLRAVAGLEMHGQLAIWAVRMLLVQLPEPEIYYPKGVELTLALKQPLLSPKQEGPAQTIAPLSVEDREEIAPLLETLPMRTLDPKKNRPSDLVNVMLVGSRDEVSEAFKAAGWSGAERQTWGSGVRQIRAVADGSGYVSAPVSNLLLDGTAPDMVWQKGFNDASKRHHIRIWKQGEMVDGEEIWLGAATRDIDFAFLRPGHAMTHKIESNVDLERQKVIDDLQFTGCVSAIDSFERPSVPVYTQNATGDTIFSDARLAVAKLNTCSSVRLKDDDDAPPLPRHGNGWQRLARREVLTFRNEMLRENTYFRAYEGIRWGIVELHERRERRLARTKPIATPEVELARRPIPGGRIISDMLR